MKESTKRRKRRQEHEKQWAEIVALTAGGLSKAETARRAKCCRQTVYNVLRLAAGLAEDEAPVPRKPGPAPGTGKRIADADLRQVVEYREQHPELGYHYCRHDLMRQGFAPPAAATIARAWRRAGLLSEGARPEPRPTRWTPPRPQAPGHVQVDVKYLPGKRFEYTAIDVYSRYVFARVEACLDSHTAARFLRDLRFRAPFTIHTIQVDGGAEFKHEFQALIQRLKLARRQNAAHNPWQNGCVERFHRTVAEECYLALAEELDTIPTAKLNRALQSYLLHYNRHRLHSALGYRPPVELLRTTSEPVYPDVPAKCPSIP